METEINALHKEAAKGETSGAVAAQRAKEARELDAKLKED